MKYTIEPLDEKDIPFLWEMLYQSIYVSEDEATPSRDILKEANIEKYLKDWGHFDDYALIAKDMDKNPIGAVWIRLFSKDNSGYGFVNENTPELGMAIHSQYRGQGIGKHLLSKMVSLASKAGYPAVSLSVDPRNKKALQLYENSGFVKVYEDSGGSWTMQKSIS